MVSTLLFVFLCVPASLGRPYSIPHQSGSLGLSSVTDHIPYWLSRVGWALSFWRTGTANSEYQEPGGLGRNFSADRIGPVGNWGWGDSDISVVDHDPVISFQSRPAAFGPRILTPPGLLGYVLPLSSFAFHCPGEVEFPSPPIPIPIPTPIPTPPARDPSNFACPDLCTYKPDRRPDRSETWVALVQRGECSFVDKVREAQKFGARGVIVGGSEDTTDGDDLITMYSTTRSDDITIPSTYITHASYKSLMGLIQVSNTTISGLRTVSLLMGSEEIWQWPLLTISLLLLLPSIMTLATLLIHRIRQARSERRERAPEDIVHSLPTGVWTGEGVEFHNAEKEAGVIAHKLESAPTPVDPAPQQLENDATTPNDAPTPETTAETSSAAAAPPSSPPPSISHHVPVNGRGRKYLKKAWFAEQSECAICLSDFEKGDQLRILPCGHIFHQDEVDAWLIQRKKLCPVCKADITVVSRPPSIRSSSTPQLTTSTPSSPIPEVFGQYISFPVPLTPPVVNPPPTESSPLLGQNR